MEQSSNDIRTCTSQIIIQAQRNGHPYSPPRCCRNLKALSLRAGQYEAGGRPAGRRSVHALTSKYWKARGEQAKGALYRSKLGHDGIEAP
jgi:hypothetical protein